MFYFWQLFTSMSHGINNMHASFVYACLSELHYISLFVLSTVNFYETEEL